MVFTFNIRENNNIKANTVLIYLKFIFKRLENYYLPTDCVQIKMLGYMTESPNKCEGKYYHSELFAVKISWIGRLKPFRFLYKCCLSGNTSHPKSYKQSSRILILLVPILIKLLLHQQSCISWQTTTGVNLLCIRKFWHHEVHPLSLLVTETKEQLYIVLREEFQSTTSIFLFKYSVFKLFLVIDWTDQKKISSRFSAF